MTTDTVYRNWRPELELRAGGDGRTVRGIMVPYNQPTRIDSTLVEEFMPGVIRHQFGAESRIKFAREHLVLGGTLIGRGIDGVWRDDARGLYGELRVARTPAGEETLELIKDGALDELSVGFHPVTDARTKGGVLQRVKVHMGEVAAVLAGAYGRGAVALGVRSADQSDPAVQAALRASLGEAVLQTPNRAEAARLIASIPPLV